MTIYKTLTPIHVGTGVQAGGLEFHAENGKLHRYLLEDILSQIPSTMLLNSSMLQNLSKSIGKKPQAKEPIYREFQNKVNFRKLEPVYSCFLNVEYPNEILYKDVFEQVKDLNRPYIPGSTLKGAVENAFRYAFLKDNFTLAVRHLPRFLDDLGKRTVKEGFVLQLLGEDGKTSDEFFRDLFSCLTCPDIHFETMDILEGMRFGKTSRSDIPLPYILYIEAISVNQTVSGQMLLTLDEKKLKQLRDTASEAQRRILDSFNLDYLCQACRTYTADMLDSELSEYMLRYYDDLQYGYLPDFCRSLKRTIQNTDQNRVYLRVGKYTSYFFKTISWLIREKSPELYRQYFQESFSPVGRMNRGRTLDPKTMPSTRTILWNLDDAWLPGFLEITL